MRLAHLIIPSLLLLWPALAGASELRLGDLLVEQPVMPQTLRGAKNGVGYLTIRNLGQHGDRLVGAESPAARAVEVHTHIREGDILRMRPAGPVDIPPGQEARFAPGGLHLMFIGLEKPLSAGERVDLVLVFERAGRLPITLEVIPLRPSGGQHHH